MQVRMVVHVPSLICHVRYLRRYQSDLDGNWSDDEYFYCVPTFLEQRFPTFWGFDTLKQSNVCLQLHGTGYVCLPVVISLFKYFSEACRDGIIQ